MYMLATLASTSHPTCRLPGGGFDEDVMSLTLRSLNATDATCNDGTAASFYFRPCCDGATYEDWCNTSTTSRWFVVFGDGNSDGWCWDAESCAARAASTPSLTSSKGLPKYFRRDGARHTDAVGAFDKTGEQNPNFYKAYAAYVPHCSSDLFTGASPAGSSPSFRGNTIAKAALAAVRVEMEALGPPWEVVIVGGAGIVASLPELRAALPAAAAVSAVCDGCVLLDLDLDTQQPPTHPHQRHRQQQQQQQGRGAAAVASGSATTTTTPSCDKADAHSCPPATTLPGAAKLWHASLRDDCGGWRCLLNATHHRPSDPSDPSSRSSSPLPLLAQQPLYDEQTATAHATADAETLRAALLDSLSGADVVVASACAGPSDAFTRSAFSTVSVGGGSIPPPTFASGLYALVTNGSRALVDTCTGAGCNPTCKRGSSVVVES